jgi:putative heme-binding domain-containing protein
MRNEGNEELQTAVDQLAGLFAAARTTVADSKEDRQDQLAALRVLGRGVDHQAEDMADLAKLLAPQVDADLRTAAVAALGQLRDPKVPDILLREWKSYSPTLRTQVLDVLLRRDDWLKIVLDALDRKHVLPADIDAPRRQRLLGHKTPVIRDRAAKALAGAVNPDRQKVIDSYRAVLTLAGDATRGLTVFQKACATCHRLGDVGQQVGPDLASVGDKSPEGLLIAILDPNRAVEARYVNYFVATKNGQTFNGVLASETGTAVSLIGADGKSQVILRTDLEEFASTGKSFMPEGLEKDLKPLDVADVIAFVRASTPRPKPKTFAGNKPELVRPSDDGSLYLLAGNCAIFGKTLIFEKQYGNLGFWQSEDDQAVWTVEVTQPGTYAVWLRWACASDSAGNGFVFQAPGERLTGEVAGTGTWDNYRKAKVGEIKLPAGKHKVMFRSAGPIKGALIDLQSIQLAPVGGGR